MKRSFVHNCSGMLLIEVLAASLLVALTSLLLYSIYWSSLNGMKDARSETLASSTAFAILESLRDNEQGIAWDQSNNLAIPFDVDTGVVIPSGMKAFLKTQPLSEQPHLVGLRVRLEWNGVKETKSLEMVTLVRK
ncbi:MAG TPA: hypothetical protein VN426_03710 [Syntrophomonadaceae bacterium]|nr:hypothetical protein [Syntrophomonadaceae bacterium]